MALNPYTPEALEAFCAFVDATEAHLQALDAANRQARGGTVVPIQRTS